MNSLLSERGKVAEDWEDFCFKYFLTCNSDLYEEKTNCSGYINFGVAVNRLCDDILHPKLNDIWSLDFESLDYKEGRGTSNLRTAMANMMTEFLESHKPISADDLFCFTGATACIDVLAHCLADPGEVFLVPAPMYCRIPVDFTQRALVEVWPIHVITEDGDDSGLTMEKIIHAYESALSANKEVRGIFLINPNNPLGDIYSPELLMDIMTFCKGNSLHCIVDEVYALSVFSESEKFHSVFKFPNIPDTNRTHVVYGLSKDFAVAGLRVGVIHTKCKELQRCLQQLAYLQSIPPPIMDTVTTLLSDLDWCREFVKTNKKRLGENYAFCSNYLKEIGVKVRECSSGFYLWVDLTNLCGSSFDEEKKLFDFFFDNFHLYISPGKEFHCAQPGWFRIIITHRASEVKEALKRFKQALKEYKESKK